MDVEVHYSLPRCLADIYPYIVTIGSVFGIELGTRLIQHFQERIAFGVGGIEEVGKMASWNYQAMARAHGIVICPHVGQIVFEK